MSLACGNSCGLALRQGTGEDAGTCIGLATDGEDDGMFPKTLQTAIKPGMIELDKLKNNLHAILTSSDQFLPHAELKQATGKIYITRPPV